MNLAQPHAHPDGSVTFGSDDKLFVQFSTRAELHGFRSQQESRPVFVPVDYIKIMQPGERDTIERPVNDFDKMRFRRQWEDYQAGREQIPTGTPLDMLFPAEPEIVASLKHLRIFTVEQLASLSDTGLGQIGLGGREFKERAGKYLDAAQNMAGAHALQRELDAEREAHAKTRDMLTRIEQRLAALEAEDDEEAAPRRRGRPPRAA